jgi:hypothetical protein
MKEAVYAALSRIGDRSSGPELVEEASRYYKGGEVEYSAAIQGRLAWRKEHGSGNDCRTNETQFRRNMLDDGQFTGKGWKMTMTVIKDTPPETLADWLEQFHSIDQLRNILRDIHRLKVAA